VTPRSEVLEALAREAQARQEQQRRQQQEILDGAPANIYVKDLDGRYEFVNSGLLELTGMTREQLLGRTDHEIFGVQADQWRINDRRALDGPVDDFEVAGDPPSAVYRSTKFPLRDAVGTPYAVCGISVNVTDAYRAERAAHTAQRRVEQLERVDTLGRFAGGLAHDLRNMLTSVRGLVELALEEAEGSEVGAHDALTDALHEARTAVLRSADHIQRMLAATQPQDTLPQPIEVRTLLMRVRPLLVQALRGRRQLEAVPPDTWTLLADGGELEQVLLNLVTNAADAVGPDGVVALSAVSTELRDQLGAGPDQQTPDLPPGRYVRLDVVDDGAGMDHDVLARATQPLYSTKAGGSGLGLWLAHALLLRNRGAFVLRSEPGRGTTASLWVPAADGAAAGSVERSERPGFG